MLDIKADFSENVKYDYPDFPIYIRRCPLSVFPNYAADSHWHDDIELIAILSGQMQYNVNGEIVTMNEGEGILVNARQLHYGFSETKTECDFICILFHPVLLCTSKMFETDFVKPFINSDIPYVHLSKDISWQKNMVKYICEMCENRTKSTSPLCSQGYVHLLWNELIENTELAKANQGNSGSKLSVLKNMMSYIHNSYKEKISLNEIASSGGVSKRTCENIFAKYLNKTPMEYVTDFRLRKSIEMMLNSDISILEISIESGFSGASYYAEVFRKAFGVSPAEYRKMK